MDAQAAFAGNLDGRQPARGSERDLEPEDAFDVNCFDFTAYLARRFAMSPDRASHLLGQWLLSYEPVPLDHAQPMRKTSAAARELRTMDSEHSIGGTA